MAAAATPKSTIEIVLDKLEPSIHTQLFSSPSSDDPNAARRRAALVADGEEALRLLKVKRAQLMPKDTPMVRAALVVDYLSRNASTDTTVSNKAYHRTSIPVPMLAKAAGLPKKFEVMQAVLASYLGGSSIGNRSGRQEQKRSQQGRKRGASSLQPNKGSSSATAASKPMISPTNLIRDLCIQLVPMIPDAEFATSYATKLLEFLTSTDVVVKRLADGTKRRLSRYELRRDMGRHQECYEAACFYIAVKKSEGESSHLINLNKKMAAKKDSKSSKQDEGTQGSEDEDEDTGGDDDERSLSEMDVVRAAGLIEGTFKTVLAYVRDWAEDVEISLERSEADETGGSSTKRLFDMMAEGDGSADQRTTRPIDDAFEQWKEKVLDEAKKSVMATTGEGGDKDWLTLAADEVLRKAGIKPG